MESYLRYCRRCRREVPSQPGYCHFCKTYNDDWVGRMAEVPFTWTIQSPEPIFQGRPAQSSVDQRYDAVPSHGQYVYPHHPRDVGDAGFSPTGLAPANSRCDQPAQTLVNRYSAEPPHGQYHPRRAHDDFKPESFAPAISRYGRQAHSPYSAAQNNSTWPPNGHYADCSCFTCARDQRQVRASPTQFSFSPALSWGHAEQQSGYIEPTHGHPPALPHRLSSRSPPADRMPQAHSRLYEYEANSCRRIMDITDRDIDRNEIPDTMNPNLEGKGHVSRAPARSQFESQAKYSRGNKDAEAVPHSGQVAMTTPVMSRGTARRRRQRRRRPPHRDTARSRMAEAQPPAQSRSELVDSIAPPIAPNSRRRLPWLTREHLVRYLRASGVKI